VAEQAARRCAAGAGLTLPAALMMRDSSHA